MNKEQLKQRIVGAIVLVALAVIFIPIILDNDEGGISGSNIPELPKELEKLAERELPAKPITPEKKPVTKRIIDEKTPEDKQVETATVEPKTSQQTPVEKPAEKTEKQSSAAKETTQRAWVVQVASFAERDKALALRDKLRKAKYTAFVESVTTKQGQLYRVRVGPVVKRSEAEILQKKIIKRFQLKDALVMAHP